ncbi:MAG TPA: COX15/CtaA family protein [Mycobacteriales bacterium]|jgi:cytochrome c oxidase assembly protein subunit 15|nr:COX15/CtaA family protein [Mycobacteriales bacterium]
MGVNVRRSLVFLALAAVVTNAAIALTGAVVRLTGSGLGCPTWPECTDGKLVAHAELGIHGYLEFGNRMLTFVVVAIPIAALLLSLLVRPRRRPVTRLAAGLIGGIFANALLGGITVLTGLNPWTVAGHFLVSVGLTYLAYALWVRVRETGDGPREWTAPPAARALVRAVVGAALLTLTLGTIVTGSGPHAGDPKTPRMGFAPETVSQLHADAVFLLIGLTVAAILTVRALGAPERVRHALVVLLVVELAQGAIGYVQYFTGLPIVLVAAHVAGAMVLWVAALRPLFALRTRSAEPVTAPVDVPAESTPARA